MTTEYSLYFTVVGGLLGTYYLAFNIYQASKARSKLRDIPIIGPSGILSSYLGAWKYLFDGKEMVQEGYDKYPGSAFRVPLFNSWMIIVSGPNMVDFVRKAPDDLLSNLDDIEGKFHVGHSVGIDVHGDPYHFGVIQKPLTRNLTARFDDLADEIATAFSDLVPVTASNDWVKVPAHRTASLVIIRTGNRLFIDLPEICRNLEFIALNEHFGIDLFKAAHIIAIFPNFLKSFVGRHFTGVPGSIDRAVRILGPILEERLEMEDKYGPDWPDKPNDLVSWLLEDAKGSQRSVRDLTVRILLINAAAIHTTGMAATEVLFDLAAYPSYVPELREEVESVIKEGGLNKESLAKMYKLDSFVKESGRMHAIRGLNMDRKIRKDVALSDGTIIPAGNTLAVAMFSTHYDEDNYKDPNKFDGLRFYRMEGDRTKHQYVSTTPDYLLFGHGRHACPGRFLAAYELKLMVAHILLNYDIKLTSSIRPEAAYFMQMSFISPKHELMFRKRSS